MATTEYETTYTPARTKKIKGSMEMASTIALRDIVDQNTTNIQWSESAYKCIKRRMISIKMLSPIVEHLLPPPEIEEDKKSTFGKLNLWSQDAIGHAGAQMARTLEADISQQIAQAARNNQKVKDHYQAGNYRKIIKEAGLSTNGCQVTNPRGKLVEMVEVPSKNDPERNVLISEQHITTAKAQDFSEEDSQEN